MRITQVKAEGRAKHGPGHMEWSACLTPSFTRAKAAILSLATTHSGESFQEIKPRAKHAETGFHVRVFGRIGPDTTAGFM